MFISSHPRHPFQVATTVAALFGVLVLGSCNLPAQGGHMSAEPTETETPSAEASGPKAGDEMRWFDGSIFRYVPPNDAVPEAFWISGTGIDANQYDACVQSGACTPVDIRPTQPADVSGNPIPAALQLNLIQAQSYCQWINGNVATDAQLQAARAALPGLATQPGNQPPAQCLLRSIPDIPGPVCGRQASSFGVGWAWNLPPFVGGPPERYCASGLAFVQFKLIRMSSSSHPILTPQSGCAQSGDTVTCYGAASQTFEVTVCEDHQPLVDCPLNMHFDWATWACDCPQGEPYDPVRGCPTASGWTGPVRVRYTTDNRCGWSPRRIFNPTTLACECHPGTYPDHLTGLCSPQLRVPPPLVGEPALGDNVSPSTSVCPVGAYFDFGSHSCQTSNPDYSAPTTCAAGYEYDAGGQCCQGPNPWGGYDCGPNQLSLQYTCYDFTGATQDGWTWTRPLSWVFGMPSDSLPSDQHASALVSEARSCITVPVTTMERVCGPGSQPSGGGNGSGANSSAGGSSCVPAWTCGEFLNYDGCQCVAP
jgi:hypothetical protein